MNFEGAAVLLLLVAATSALPLDKGPPSANNPALMARYVVNQAEWTAISTISANKDLAGHPFVNLKSISDGPLGLGSGVPYFFITPRDFTGIDIVKDNRVSLLMTLAQTDYCKSKGYDPMNPLCPRVILTGKLVKFQEADPERATAKDAIFKRHPWLSKVPEDHGFYFAKLEIEKIIVLAQYGGAEYVSVKDYFKAN